MTPVDDKIVQQSKQLRHELHQIAELSGKEHKTADRIKEMLRSCSPDEIIDGVGGNGIIAIFKGKEEGPSVVIRSELDALPIPEENELEYGSKTEGVAHKCGHDGHMAIVAGIAAFLRENRPSKGDVYLLFQPAEETGQGAAKILDDERFKQIEPDYMFALHNLPGYPKHQILLRDGVFAAASRGFEVELKGETSHAAHPENGQSPALALASLIQNFSAFPQFYSTLDEAAKVTVIHSKLGEVAFGTSPGYAEFRATIRTYRNKLMKQLCERAERLVKDTAEMHQLTSTARWTELFEATKSDESCNRIIEKAASVNGLESFRKETPFAWSEDFGRFTSQHKGAIFGLGAGEQHPQLHSSMYDFPDDLIPTGISMFVEIIKQITGVNH
ncbi:MAG: amidohydrolase [Balneolaceae bacterium]|nr:amidohydrolase [Balneolaceae bacterium]